MPDPEILRRCHACGAAYRPGALFCPQCGNAVTATGAKSGVVDRDGQDSRTMPLTGSAAQQRRSDSTENRVETLEDHPSDSSKSPERVSNIAAPVLQDTLAIDSTDAPSVEVSQRRIPDSANMTGRPDSANVAGRPPSDATGHGVRPRVEKLRQASSVVFEGATYDPSIRFVLVATALFVLFLVLLILSKVIV